MLQYTIATQGALKRQTVKITAGDASQLFKTLVDAALVAAGSTAVDDWGRIKTVFLTCEAFDARVSFGVAASATCGHVFAAGASWLLAHQSMIQNSYIINKTGGSNAVIMVTLGY